MTSKPSEAELVTSMAVKNFWAKVDKSGECWLWQGKRDKHGYGATCWNSIAARAHRLAWMLANGPIEKGLSVLHRCDTPPCVNPAHLFLGTRADNIADMVSKKRQPVGEQNGASKLDAARVRTARILVGLGVTQASVSRWLGVCSGHVSEIISRKRWGHLA